MFWLQVFREQTQEWGKTKDLLWETPTETIWHWCVFISGRFHQKILSELQNWNSAPRLPQCSASPAAGKPLQRKGWRSQTLVKQKTDIFLAGNNQIKLICRWTLWSWCIKHTASASWTTPLMSTFRRWTFGCFCIKSWRHPLKWHNLTYFIPDPELSAPLLAGDARPPAASAGKPGYRRHLLRLWLHPL